MGTQPHWWCIWGVNRPRQRRVWGRHAIELVSIWDRFGIDPGSIWRRSGLDIGVFFLCDHVHGCSLWSRFGDDVMWGRSVDLRSGVDLEGEQRGGRGARNAVSLRGGGCLFQFTTQVFFCQGQVTWSCGRKLQFEPSALQGPSEFARAHSVPSS